MQVNYQNNVQKYPLPQMNATFKANPVATTNMLERTPTSDTIVNSTENKVKTKTKTKTKKILLTIGAIATAGIGIAYAIKKAQVKDVKNLHKTLKEGFLNESLTEKEALAIKKRYQEIFKIKDRNECAKAIFEETKKNFGLEKSNITLKLEKLNGAFGGYCPKEHQILVTPDCHKMNLLETLCHEFRHAKQMQLASNIDPNFAKSKMDKNILISEMEKIADKYIDNCGIKISDEMLQDFMSQDFMSQAKDNIVFQRFGNLSENNIPENLKEYAKKMLSSLKNAKDPTKDLKGYWNSYHEIDARKSSGLINKYVKENAFDLGVEFSWITDIEKKFLSWVQECKRNKNP